MLDANGAVARDLVDKVSRSDRFGHGWILLEDVKNVAIFRDVALNVGVGGNGVFFVLKELLNINLIYT